MARPKISKLSNAIDLWIEHSTDGVQQICEWPVTRPFPGRCSGRMYPSKICKIDLDRSSKFTVGSSHSFVIIKGDLMVIRRDNVKERGGAFDKAV